MYKRFRQLIASFLIMILFLCGCRFSDITASGEISSKNQVSKQFDAFTRQLFIDAVSTDALTLHYELMDPSAYDISLDTLNLGRIDKNAAADAESELEDTLKELHSFTYDKLTDKQQITFDILDEYLRTELSVDNQELFYYPNVSAVLPAPTVSCQYSCPNLHFTTKKM